MNVNSFSCPLDEYSAIVCIFLWNAPQCLTEAYRTVCKPQMRSKTNKDKCSWGFPLAKREKKWWSEWYSPTHMENNWKRKNEKKRKSGKQFIWSRNVFQYQWCCYCRCYCCGIRFVRCGCYLSKKKWTQREHIIDSQLNGCMWQLCNWLWFLCSFVPCICLYVYMFMKMPFVLRSLSKLSSFDIWIKKTCNRSKNDFSKLFFDYFITNALTAMQGCSFLSNMNTKFICRVQ